MMDAIIPIQEIKRRGLTAVDDGLRRHAAVTVVRNNRAAYVVLTPETYEALLQDADDARLAQSLADWQARSCKTTSVDELMAEASAHG
ncbi:MAG: prevent-host-death protein [Verrucomicrobia bacterium]|nr:prevent-host-death protein [Verrucomicrobiota bacterium]